MFIIHVWSVFCERVKNTTLFLWRNDHMTTETCCNSQNHVYMFWKIAQQTEMRIYLAFCHTFMSHTETHMCVYCYWSELNQHWTNLSLTMSLLSFRGTLQQKKIFYIAEIVSLLILLFSCVSLWSGFKSIYIV